MLGVDIGTDSSILYTASKVLGDISTLPVSLNQSIVSYIGSDKLQDSVLGEDANDDFCLCLRVLVD
jgi:hypothetical protein